MIIKKIYLISQKATDRTIKFEGEPISSISQYRKYEQFVQLISTYTGLPCEMLNLKKQWEKLPVDGLYIIFSEHHFIKKIRKLDQTLPLEAFRKIFLVDFGGVFSELDYQGLPLAGSMQGHDYMSYFVLEKSINSLSAPGFVADSFVANKSFGTVDNHNYYQLHPFKENIVKELGQYLTAYIHSFEQIKTKQYDIQGLASDVIHSRAKVGLDETLQKITSPMKKVYIVSQKPANLQSRKDGEYVSVCKARKYEALAESIATNTFAILEIITLDEEWTNFPLDGMIILFAEEGFVKRFAQLKIAHQTAFTRRVFIVDFGLSNGKPSDFAHFTFAGFMNDTDYEICFVQNTTKDSAGFYGNSFVLSPENCSSDGTKYGFYYLQDSLQNELADYLKNYIEVFDKLCEPHEK
ncbi:hypothetical protein [Microscilla marina]|uniref:Uncharacterized protein n=1 Tax=Microscilla marina ATCC 23134 TaxID=313606 RepID=A1ZUJ2_MICM2|nr:hypothetical protein [Microscilla marina]EAY26011.1 hypothetical protein M23134_07160 [Microscilla marina ATCC 23134]